MYSRKLNVLICALHVKVLSQVLISILYNYKVLRLLEPKVLFSRPMVTLYSRLQIVNLTDLFLSFLNYELYE